MASTETIRRKESELRNIIHSSEVESGVHDLRPHEIAEARDRQDELVGLNNERNFERMAELAEKQMWDRRRDEARRVPEMSARRLSERVVEHDGYALRASNLNFDVPLDGVDFKSLLSISNATYLPANPRTDIVSVYPQRRPMIADAIPQDPTTDQTVKYMRGTALTSEAASTSEGSPKGEVGLEFTEESAPTVKITAWIPATEEQISSVLGIRNLIDNQLTLQILLVEETKILGGPGGGDMTGIYNTAGVQTQPKGPDTMADAIYKAMSLVRYTGFGEPSAVMINQVDFDAMRLAKNTVGDYIWGPPSLPGPDCIWGKPAVISPAVTLGKPLVGDFVEHAHISRRLDGRVRATDSHLDYFANNILAIVGEERIALEVYRPQAFAYVIS